MAPDSPHRNALDEIVAAPGFRRVIPEIAAHAAVAPDRKVSVLRLS
jgi:hypothetical protein